MPSSSYDLCKGLQSDYLTRWIAIDKAKGLHQILMSRHRIDIADMWVAPQIRNVTRSAIVDRWVLGVLHAKPVSERSLEPFVKMAL